MRGATEPAAVLREQEAISIHAPHAGSDPPSLPACGCGRHFNPRSPCGERHMPGLQSFRASYFNPRSPCGERPPQPSAPQYTDDFNPRSPCGERLPALSRISGSAYFNPRSPCGERRRVAVIRGLLWLISIHAPHAGSDRSHPNPPSYDGNFNPRSPCGERPCLRSARSRASDFNPRSPCGERRSHWSSAYSSQSDFNPRSPCGERLQQVALRSRLRRISIHAPHAGSDQLSREGDEP